MMERIRRGLEGLNGKLAANITLKREKRNILTLTSVEDSLYFDLIGGEAGRKIEIEYRLNYLLEKNNNSLNKRLEGMAKTINQDLLHKEYLKYPVTVSLNLDGVFVERMTLPRLSGKELKRAIGLEMGKLYGDYESKFIASALLTPAGKQLYNLRVALFGREDYRQILEFLQDAKLKVDKITLAQDNFKNLILNKKCFQRQETPISSSMWEKGSPPSSASKKSL